MLLLGCHSPGWLPRLVLDAGLASIGSRHGAHAELVALGVGENDVVVVRVAVVAHDRRTELSQPLDLVTTCRTAIAATTIVLVALTDQQR